MGEIACCFECVQLEILVNYPNKDVKLADSMLTGMQFKGEGPNLKYHLGDHYSNMVL